MRYHIAAIPVLAALMVSSCLLQQQQNHGSDGKEAKDSALKNPPLYLGTVHQVYPEQKFVLLRIIGPLPSPGTTLITHPADGSVSRLGNVCVTTEKAARNGIIAADVRAGTVLRGDRVFLYRNVSDHSPKEEENPEETDTTQTDIPTTPTGDSETTDNEHPRIFNTPATVGNADIPDPVREDDGDDTTVEQTPEPPQQPANDTSIPLPSGSPGTAPSYLDEIPDDINEWN